MTIFIKLVYLSSVISLKWQLIGNLHRHLSEITELKYISLIKMIILEENFKWHLEAFASELFICMHDKKSILCHDKSKLRDENPNYDLNSPNYKWKSQIKIMTKELANNYKETPSKTWNFEVEKLKSYFIMYLFTVKKNIVFPDKHQNLSFFSILL